MHFNELVRNPALISCALKAILPGACSITTSTSGLRGYPTVDRQSMNILKSLSVLRFSLTFFISAVSVCCMLPRLSYLLTRHNDVIDARY